jgi:addiction module HigA family antidote
MATHLKMPKARKPTRSIERRPSWAAQHPRKRPPADLFHLARRGCARCRDCGLSLRGAYGAEKEIAPIHPGELLRDELNEIGVSLNELARALRVPMNRISAIVNGKRAITVDTAMRLARYFGTSPQYWLNLQNAYDLEVADQKMRPQIEKEVLPRSAA